MHTPRSKPRLASLPARRHHETMQALKHHHELLHAILERTQAIMSASDDIKAALADLSAETTAETDLLTAIDTKMAGLSAQIAALEQQIIDNQNNSGGLSAAEVAEVQASLAALKSATDANKAKEEIMANTPTP